MVLLLAHPFLQNFLRWLAAFSSIRLVLSYNRSDFGLDFCQKHELVHISQGGAPPPTLGRKSTNPFDLSYDSDLEPSTMVCDI